MQYLMLKIYADVMADERLWSLEERLIVCWILDLESQGKQCYASDSFFARLFACSETYIQTTLQSLQERNVVSIKRSITSNARLISLCKPQDQEPDLDIFDQLAL